MSSIVLIGFMGAGKTTVGKELVKKGFELIDTRNIDLKTVKNQAIPVHQALPQVSLQAQEQSASLTILWKERSQAS